jgi:hypothetical protein
MAGLSDYKLKFVIDADGRTAKQELNSVYAEINKLGGGLTSTFGGAIPILGAVAGGLTAVAGGIALVTAGLYAASKQAAEYGSEIYDASIKTGLHAETISALKLASDRSGTSLENTANTVVKLTKNLGEAAQKAGPAREALTRLGIDPHDAIQDLDGTLAKVIQRVSELPDPVSRGTAATQLFGKSGAEFLKVIDDMKGNLPGAVTEVKRLGLSLSDDAARAADEFGDQLDTLDKQFHGIRVTIGQAFMPIFNDMAHTVSDWLAENQGELRRWADQTQTSLRGAASYWEHYWSQLKDSAQDYYTWLEQKQKDLPLGLGTRLPDNFAVPEGGYIKDATDALRKEGERTRGATATGGLRTDDYLADLDAQKAAADKAQKEREAAAKRSAAAQIDILKTQLSQAQHLYEYTYQQIETKFKEKGGADVFLEGYRKAFAILQGELSTIIPQLDKAEMSAARSAKATAAEIQKLQQEHDVRNQQLSEFGTGIYQRAQGAITDQEKKGGEDESSQAKLKMDRMLEIYRVGYDKRKVIQEAYLASGVINETQYAQNVGRIAYEAMMDEIRLNQQLVDSGKLSADQRAEAEQKLAVLKLQLGTQIIQTATAVASAQKKASEDIAKAADEEAKAFRELAAARWEASMATAEYVAQQRDMIESLRASQPLEDAFVDMGDMISSSIEQWTQGIGSLVEAWVLYGTAGPDAMRKMTAQVLASLAAQAAAKALFYTAEGIVALFLDPPLAGAFFSAAAIMGSIAIGAAVAGRAVAGDSFKKDKSGDRGDKHFSTGNTSKGRGSAQSEDLKPYSRQTEDAFVSGRRDESSRVVADAIDRLNKKLESMRPGDVLVAGTREKPGHIGQQVAKDIDRDAGIGKKILQKSGVR